ncbi:hypothetical protein [Paraburkholderia xenovorans]
MAKRTVAEWHRLSLKTCGAARIVLLAPGRAHWQNTRARDNHLLNIAGGGRKPVEKARV